MQAARIPVFLLGAGASQQAGIPLSRELTTLLLDWLSDGVQFSREAAALSFVVGSIIHHDSRTGQRPDVLPDIERFASAVELLAGRSELEVVPFVSTWDGTVEALEQRSPRNPPFFEREVAGAITGSRQSSPHRVVNNLVQRALKGSAVTSAQFDRELRKAIAEPDQRKLGSALVKLIDARTASLAYPAFALLLKALVQGVVRELCKSPDSAFDYLSPIASIAEAHPGQPTIVATLNYDLGVESMARRAGCLLDRAIADWSSTGNLTQPNSGISLLKLHGSIDWVRHEAQGPLLASALSEVDPNSLDPFGPSPFMVFGQREKLRAGGPFLQLLEAFRSSLDATSYLVIIGYSFRDAHINELISRWFNASSDHRIVIVDPFFPASPQPIDRADFLSGLLAAARMPASDEGGGDTARVLVTRVRASEFLARLDTADPTASLATEFASS